MYSTYQGIIVSFLIAMSKYLREMNLRNKHFMLKVGGYHSIMTK